MPRYSTTGVIAAGVGKAQVSLNGAVVAVSAGGACWLDTTRSTYARKVGEPDVWALKAHNGIVEIAIDEAGATELRAGGGVWAAELGGPGVRSNRHPELPLAGLRDVGPDGTLAYCRARQDGRGLILRALDGATTTLVTETAACKDVQVHSATEATWIQGGRIKSSYGDPVTPAGTCGSPRVVTINGKRLLLYWLDDDQGERLLLQTEWANPVGYVLTKPGQMRDGKTNWPAHRPDLIALETVRACWSITEAEGPTSIRELPIDLTRPVGDLRRAAVAPVTIAPFTFPTAVTWFFEDSKRPSVTPSPAPGQWSLIVESGLRPTKPVIIGLQGDAPGNEDLIAEWADRWSQVRGIYVADEASREWLRMKARLARARMATYRLAPRPVYSYSAGNLWPDIPEVDVIGVQCYPEPGETATQSETRWRASLANVAGKRVALVCGLYDRRPLVGITEAQLAACIPVYAKLARAVKAEALLLFAWGRAGGASSFPALLPSLMALAAAVIETPKLPVQKPPDDDDEDDMPKMTFDASLALMQQAAKKWRQLHGKTGQELDEGQAHIWMWRILAQGYSAEELLADVK